MSETEIRNDRSMLLGRLLAAEKITIVRAEAATASFDIKNRVLTIPVMNVEPEMEDLFIVHEVGHAKFTNDAYAEKIQSERRKANFHHYMNVVEDIRIERLMKEVFPGSRVTFSTGYGVVHSTNFFKLTPGYAARLIIDRINLAAKIGRHLPGLTLTEEETRLYDRCLTAKTIDDVYEIAIAIWKADVREHKKKARQEKQPTVQRDSPEPSTPTGESEDYEGEYQSESEEDTKSSSKETGQEDTQDENDQESESASDSDQPNEPEENADSDAETGSGTESIEEGTDEEGTDEEGTDEEGTDEVSDEDGDDMEAPSTQEAFDESFRSKVALNNVVQVDYTLIDDIDIVSFKKLDSVFREHNSFPSYKVQQFKDSVRPIVQSMVKEFNSRKSAERAKKTQYHESGQLAGNKLWKYKVANEIFRQHEIHVNQENHGFIMLLDWSGSMSNTIDSVLRQLYIVVSFCRAVNIKFEVYAFTSQSQPEKSIDVTHRGEEPNAYVEHALRFERFSLLNLYSNKQSIDQFKHASDVLLSGEVFQIPTTEVNFHLGGTPLVPAMMYVNAFISEYKRKNSIQKLSVITMTDGANNGGYVSSKIENYSTNPYGGFRLYSRKTQRSYRVGYAGETFTAMSQAVKDDNPDVKFICIFMTEPFFATNPYTKRQVSTMRVTRRSAKNFLDSYYKDYAGTVQQLVDEMNGQIEKVGYFSPVMSNFHGFFVIPCNAFSAAQEKKNKGMQAIDGEMTARQISARLSSTSEEFNMRMAMSKQLIKIIS